MIVPTRAYEGGEKAFQERLSDKNEYKKVLEGVNTNIIKRGGADKILITTIRTKKNGWMSGKNLDFIAKKIGLPPGEAL